ncbi:hypothetical protein SteCoe_32821 [Stentor coeruleus]|uniref:Uncharacterized protein n=1 Tax=Stentor coeruleus TaxID=5963 RepID=A0A1R2AY80_9CILI|nr:hypothetical protein SteCoe_32821 [Stentor coeruleus]
MFKKPEKDVLQDINFIGSFNVITKRAKIISYIWSQDLYAIQNTDIPQEVYNHFNPITINLCKLGNPVRLSPLDPAFGGQATKSKIEHLLIQKESTKDDHIRSQGGKLMEIDIKLSKKNEEIKKLQNSISFTNIKSKYKTEAIPFKVGTLATTRGYLKKHLMPSVEDHPAIHLPSPLLERKKFKESESLAHINSQSNVEDIPIKLEVPATSRNYLKKQANSKSTRILLPKILKS